MTRKNNYRGAFGIITLLFFLWGFITVLVDSLVPRLREVFELTYFQAGLVQFAFFIAYLIFSVPSGFLLSRIGYQKGIVWGLSIMAAGCLLFYPAASARLFPVFLLAYFTLAAGITVLQVAANPYVAVLGSEDGASSRLNLSQAFNSLGTAIAPAVGAIFLLSDHIKTSADIAVMDEVEKSGYYLAEASAVQNPFLVLALVLGGLSLFFLYVRLPVILSKSPKEGYGKLLKKKIVLLGVLAIFLYVGAEVAIGSYLVSYFLDMQLASVILENAWMRAIAERILNGNPAEIDQKGVVGAFVVLYWTGAMVGRFIGAYLTRVIRPAKVLTAFAALAITMLVISMNTAGLAAMFSILAVGLFNSIMFPTIFTLTLEGLGELKPQASGLLCTAIVGGAILPPAFGLLADMHGFKMAIGLLLLCYGYVLYFGMIKQKKIRDL